jgi:alpha-L-fucosidase 2
MVGSKIRFENNMICRMSRLTGTLALILTACAHGAAQGAEFNPISSLASNNVTWTVPGPTSSQSMPIGNGETGLNVWAETNGDVAFYIGKTDTWNQDVHGDQGLMKVGGMRLSLNPSPLIAGAPFSQTLRLREGEIVIQQGFATNQATIRIWVDANNPVIRVEVTSSNQPITASAKLINWRLSGGNPDVVLGGQTNRIVWYHRNSSGANSNVANLTFGAAIRGGGFANVNSTNLTSTSAATSHQLSISPLTAKTATSVLWQNQLQTQLDQIDALNLEQTREAHLNWWQGFWDRSWVFVEGDAIGAKVTQGYILQRFITACAGRGAYPIKFNGSLFVVDNPTLSKNADTRDWGGQYWFQNTRAMYWPRLGAGDFDMMLPLFRMYADILNRNVAQVTNFYGHQGAYFMETAPFWGGLNYAGPELPEDWTRHYFLPVLELGMMMLDYYEFTGDTNFAQNTLLPSVTAGLKFYDQHFARDAQGKILLDPVNSIETYWKTHNPAPDIAGLKAVLPRMIALTNISVPATNRADWIRMLTEVPDLPIGTKNGKQVLLPYTGPQTNQIKNGENPELYAIYPFRLYGLGKQDLQLATSSFKSRIFTQMGCWVQDPVQAAMVGQAATARSYMVYNFTNKEAGLKFPAFWAKKNDYAPDQDNGGNGEHALQQMIMQTDGKKILMLPAWPSGWNADFKLKAPFQTTVEGSIRNGRLTNLVVNPPERLVDVIDLGTNNQVASKMSLGSLLAASDPIVPLKRTLKGGTNTLAVSGDFGGTGNSELVGNCTDRNLNSKYFNKAPQAGGGSPGVNSGFALTLTGGAQVVNAIQIATANDSPSRDPYSITVEGSNDADARQGGGGAGFVLLYEGTAGLDEDPGRNAWGQVLQFSNAMAYASYRVLITAITGNNADAVQYSEVKLGTAAPAEVPTGGVIHLQSEANGLWVSATNNGNSPMIANKPTPAYAESLRVVDAANLYGYGYVALQAQVNNKYVTATNASSSLIPSGNSIGQQQIFHWNDNDDGTVSFRSLATGLFVCAENAGAAPLIANRTSTGPWEKFTQTTAYQSPVFSNITIAGGNVVLHGSNGLPGGTYAVLTSTNLMLPVSTWTTSTNGVFDPVTGGFSNALAINLTETERYFSIRQP